MIGNSSSALREGAFLGVPSVNIGSRQSNRERGSNIVDADYDRKQIADAIMEQINHGKYNSDKIFGDGSAALKIAEKLSNVDLEVKKTFFDLDFNNEVEK